MENKNWTKKYQIIIRTITLIIVLGSICYHFLGFSEMIGFANKNESSNDTTEYDFTGESISAIDIDMDAADLDISYGDKFTVSHNIDKKYQPNVELKNGELSITQSITRKSIHSLSDDFKIDIVIPRDSKLDKLGINIDAGDIDVLAITGKGFNLDADAGDINIVGVEFDKTSIAADAGNIGIEDSSLGKLSIDADMGEINLNDVVFSDGDIEADMGNVEVSGKFEKLDANCDLGNIEIVTPDLDAVDLNLDCSLGEITVNGKAW